MNDVLSSVPNVASYNLVCNTYNINISELQSEVNILNRLFKKQIKKTKI